MPDLDKFIINGGTPLKGNVTVSGAKNASLALMPATLLCNGTSTFRNTPKLKDVTTMCDLLSTMGARVRQDETNVEIDTSEILSHEAPYEQVKKMRASFYVLGPLLGRYGRARVSYPGGCAWGPRPVDLHLKAMKQLGAEIQIESGYVVAKTQRLQGADITFDISSVGATGNTLMAAVLAKGETVIRNAATEPEISHLAEMLLRMGAKISGTGTNCLTIEGVEQLSPVEDDNIPDRIEAGTFLAAAAATGGSVTLNNVVETHLTSVVARLRDAGCEISSNGKSMTLKCSNGLESVNITTAIYPGFPTDMQAQWMAMMSIGKGITTVTDTVYFDRFNHVPELQRLGASIDINQNTAVIHGVPQLRGATVMSTDLRASASLLIAGLVAEGTTEVLRVYHIDRGYETIEEKLRSLGADIRRVRSREY